MLARKRLLGEYNLGKTIGQGAFSKVKIAVHRETDEKVAIKVIDKKLMEEKAKKSKAAHEERERKRQMEEQRRLRALQQQQQQGGADVNDFLAAVSSVHEGRSEGTDSHGKFAHADRKAVEVPDTHQTTNHDENAPSTSKATPNVASKTDHNAVKQEGGDGADHTNQVTSTGTDHGSASNHANTHGVKTSLSTGSGQQASVSASPNNAATGGGSNSVTQSQAKLSDSSQQQPSFISKLQKEVQLMMRLDHPNIVKIYQVLETEEECFIVMEYAKGGELIEYIAARDYLSEKEARKFFRQIISAMDHCHLSNVVHRDLKLENVLLNHERNVLLSDFGLGRTFDPDTDEYMKTFCGTPNYAAVELISGIPYVGVKSDIWAMGVVLYIMMTGHPPFTGDTIQLLYRKIKAVDYKIPSYFSPDLVDLFKKILVKDPVARIDMEGLRQHPWVNYEYIESPLRVMPKVSGNVDMTTLSQVISNIYYDKTFVVYVFRRHAKPKPGTGGRRGTSMVMQTGPGLAGVQNAAMASGRSGGDQESNSNLSTAASRLFAGRPSIHVTGYRRRSSNSEAIRDQYTRRKSITFASSVGAGHTGNVPAPGGNNPPPMALQATPTSLSSSSTNGSSSSTTTPVGHAQSTVLGGGTSSPPLSSSAGFSPHLHVSTSMYNGVPTSWYGYSGAIGSPALEYAMDTVRDAMDSRSPPLTGNMNASTISGGSRLQNSINAAGTSPSGPMGQSLNRSGSSSSREGLLSGLSETVVHRRSFSAKPFTVFQSSGLASGSTNTNPAAGTTATTTGLSPLVKGNNVTSGATTPTSTAHRRRMSLQETVRMRFMAHGASSPPYHIDTHELAMTPADSSPGTPSGRGVLGMMMMDSGFPGTTADAGMMPGGGMSIGKHMFSDPTIESPTTGLNGSMTNNMGGITSGGGSASGSGGNLGANSGVSVISTGIPQPTYYLKALEESRNEEGQSPVSNAPIQDVETSNDEVNGRHVAHDVAPIAIPSADSGANASAVASGGPKLSPSALDATYMRRGSHGRPSTRRRSVSIGPLGVAIAPSSVLHSSTEDRHDLLSTPTAGSNAAGGDQTPTGVFSPIGVSGAKGFTIGRRRMSSVSGATSSSIAASAAISSSTRSSYAGHITTSQQQHHTPTSNYYEEDRIHEVMRRMSAVSPFVGHGMQIQLYPPNDDAESIFTRMSMVNRASSWMDSPTGLEMSNSGLSASQSLRAAMGSGGVGGTGMSTPLPPLPAKSKMGKDELGALAVSVGGSTLESSIPSPGASGVTNSGLAVGSGSDATSVGRQVSPLQSPMPNRLQQQLPVSAGTANNGGAGVSAVIQFTPRQSTTFEPSMQEIEEWHVTHKPPKQIRAMRFSFNSATTSSTLDPATMFQDVHRGLAIVSRMYYGSRIQFLRVPDYYMFRCELDMNGAQTVSGGGSSGGMETGPSDRLEFEVEVCKVWLLKMHGLRMKRICGDVFTFKDIYSRISSELHWV